jgi:hypothetical protein
MTEEKRQTNSFWRSVISKRGDETRLSDPGFRTRGDRSVLLVTVWYGEEATIRLSAIVRLGKKVLNKVPTEHGATKLTYIKKSVV